MRHPWQMKYISGILPIDRSQMQIKIKRIDKSLPLPLYESPGAAGFDFVARQDTVIAPQQIALIPANVIIETPENYMLQVASRGSTPRKKGLMMPHGVGIVDSDFRGPEDEIQIQMYNFTQTEVLVRRGEKIAQGIFVPVEVATWDEVDEMRAKTRGAFGSTDIK